MKKIYLNTLTSSEVSKKLQSGQVIHNNNGTEEIVFKDGILVKTVYEYDETTRKVYNPEIDILYIKDGCDYYFEEEEKFEITGTGLYRTRDGRKAFVSKVDKEGELCIVGIIDGDEDYSLWHKNGKTDPECDSDEDLFERIG